MKVEPTIGRMVDYTDMAGQTRAAVVTAVHGDVVNGVEARINVAYTDAAAAGMWSWPARA